MILKEGAANVFLSEVFMAWCQGTLIMNHSMNRLDNAFIKYVIHL